MKIFLATNIHWDTSSEDSEDFDDEVSDALGLPGEAYIIADAEEHELADILSDQYGFLVKGFSVEERSGPLVFDTDIPQ